MATDKTIAIIDHMSPNDSVNPIFDVYTPEKISQMSIDELNDYLKLLRTWTKNMESLIRSEIRVKAREQDPYYDDIPF
jgi:hypothetical protein